MRNIETNIIINAPIQTVWDNFMDFESYPEWNPFIHIEGEAMVGTTLNNTIYLERQKPQLFKPEVLIVKENQEFRWKGKLFFKGLFDGEHYFKLEAINDQQTKLIHGENFNGVLVGLIMRQIEETTLKGFHAMNKALKERCE